MGSETALKLPVIDFNNVDLLEAKNPMWEEVKSQVHKALAEHGCFEALFDKVPIELRKSMFLLLKELFDLPLQTKQLNVSKKRYHGYVGQYPHIPLYESMGVDDAVNSDEVESLEKTLWPEGHPSFSKTILSFSEQVSKLDQIIRKMVLESLGIERYIEEHMNSTNYLLRGMKYKGPQTEDTTEVGLPSHTDKNIVSILYQNEVAGLEVETKDGKWMTYKPSPHSFVVLIGESFHAWTNGRLHAAFHRVMMRGNEARYSVGLFTAPKGGYTIKAPEELVDKQHPLLFKPYDFVEFLDYFYSTPEAQAQKFALKTYCGVY